MPNQPRVSEGQQKGRIQLVGRPEVSRVVASEGVMQDKIRARVGVFADEMAWTEVVGVVRRRVVGYKLLGSGSRLEVHSHHCHK